MITSAMLGGGPWILELFGVRYVIDHQAVRDPGATGSSPSEREHIARELLLGLRVARSSTLAIGVEICRSVFSGLRVDDALPSSQSQSDTRQDLASRISEAVRSGALTARAVARPVSTYELDDEIVDLVGSGPPPLVQQMSWLHVRVVDEIGEAIDGLDLTMFYGGESHRETTDGSGVVRIDGLETSFGSAKIADFDQLRDIVRPRWETLREGKAPHAPPLTTHQLRDDISGAELEGKTPHTLVITPPLGKLFVELHDKTGRVRHVGRAYKITGSTDFQGTTDDEGRILHPNVPWGDYQLTLTLEGEDFSDEYQAALVVLDSDDEQPQVRMLGVLPRSVMVRVRGMLFETNKNFPLPMAMLSMQRIRDIYEENDPGELVVVGHTDTSGEASINDPLSIERAEAVAAYLADDVDPWLEMYDHSSQSKRWGEAEDLMMIQAVTVFGDKPPQRDSIEWFQEQHNERVETQESGRPTLEPDGVCGPKTRRELITEYMLLDGTSVAKDDEGAEHFDIELTLHGCGENFPLDATGEQLDQAAIDGQNDVQDRRVELFFFDRDFGIVPPPPGKNSAPGSSEYPQWRARSIHDDDLWVGPHVLEGTITYADGLPAAHVAFLVKAGEQTIDGGYTDEKGHYRVTIFSEVAEVSLVDQLAMGKTVQDVGGERIAVRGVPDTSGLAVA